MAATDSALTFTIPNELLEAAAHVVASRAAEILREEYDGASPWLTTEEAAEYLRIPLGTFQERAGRGEFNEIAHREGKRVYYHRQDLDAHRRGYAPGNGAASGRPPTREGAT